MSEERREGTVGPLRVYIYLPVTQGWWEKLQGQVETIKIAQFIVYCSRVSPFPVQWSLA